MVCPGSGLPEAPVGLRRGWPGAGWRNWRGDPACAGTPESPDVSTASCLDLSSGEGAGADLGPQRWLAEKHVDHRDRLTRGVAHYTPASP